MAVEFSPIPSSLPLAGCILDLRGEATDVEREGRGREGEKEKEGEEGREGRNFRGRGGTPHGPLFQTAIAATVSQQPIVHLTGS